MRNRFYITPLRYVILLSAYFMFLLNIPFILKSFSFIYQKDIKSFFYFLNYLSVLYFAFFYFFYFFQKILPNLVFKFFITLLFLISFFIAYYDYYYSITATYEMIVNVFETDKNEILDLLSFDLFYHFLATFLFFTFFLFIKIKNDNENKSKNTIILFFLFLTSVFISLKDWIIIHRNDTLLRQHITPFNGIYYSSEYILRKYFFSKNKEKYFLKIGVDAKRDVKWENIKNRTILIIVVGEAARSSHFSINGYIRDTTPYLSKRNIISFKNVMSCATSTAFSLPGMFSRIPRVEYTLEKAESEENILDILSSRCGFKVYWIDNNSSSKGVASRIGEENICNNNFYDESLLADLDNKINSTREDIIIVLHQIGSHGPAYYKRYPSNFKKFSPVCETSEIQKCEKESLINVYDNSILYTDYFLEKTISFLEQYKDVNTAMIYVSDHGESLGEYGLFLHGLPYMIAPKEQKHIPWIVWISDAFKDNFKINLQKLKEKESNDISHDHLFHSILGLLNIETKEYDKSLDVFHSEK